MEGYMDGQPLFYAGIALLVIGAVGIVIAVILLTLAHRRLNKHLTQEYGDKRR